MLVTEIGYTIPESHRGPFETLFKVLRETFGGFPRIRGFKISRSFDEPGRYLAQFEWDSLADEQASFDGGPASEAVLAALRPFSVYIDQIRRYEVLQAIGTRLAAPPAGAVVAEIGYTVPESQRAAFETLFEVLRETFGGFPHIRGFQVSRSLDESGRYLARFEWGSLADEQASFVGEPASEAVIGALRPFSVCIDQIRRYEVFQVAAKPHGRALVDREAAVEILRPDDLLFLKVAGENLRLDANVPAAPRLVRADTSKPAFLVVRFPPQTIAEQTFVVGPLATPAPGYVRSRIAGPTRLVFRLPDDLDDIPYTIEGLLDWSRLELAVTPVAAVLPDTVPEEPPPIAEPSALETSIELPYRLILSPGPDAAWTHARRAVEHRGRTELWHTRLGRRTPKAQESDAEQSATASMPLRAVWSPDYVGPDGDLPPASGALALSDTPMAARERHEIVALTSAFSGYYFDFSRAFGVPDAHLDYEPQPIQADQLMLSGLGGWLRSHGQWPVVREVGGESIPLQSDRNPIILSEWRHVAAQGRDHYVRLVFEGRLFPFGHRAALVQVTERRFETDGPLAGTPVAYLRLYRYIVVREPEKVYTPGEYEGPGEGRGREMPLGRVRITTAVTPHFGAFDPLTAAPSFFVPTLDRSVLFRFQLIGRDAEDRAVEFTTPLVFVPLNETDVPLVNAKYAADARRACEVGSRKLAFAPEKAPGDTQLETSTLRFSAIVRGHEFVPKLDNADVRIPAVDHLVGSAGPTTIELYDGYVTGGFTAVGTGAEVFARLATAYSLRFTAQQAGGIATPGFGITGVGRASGPVGGDLGRAASGTIVPADFFGGADAKLFGSVDLAQLVRSGTEADLGRAPKIVTEVAPDASQVTTRLDWQPPLVSSRVGLVTPRAGANLTLKGRLVQLAGAPGGAFELSGTMANFFLDLFDVIKLAFDEFRFHAASGQKLEVRAKLSDTDPVVFEGPLEFVNALAEVIPPGLFGSDGPKLEVGPDGILVGYSLSLPPLNIGVLALKDASISAALDLPFANGKPHLDFAFAERHHPFLLTVELLGGGGFVHVDVDASGVILVEGSLEFGGDFSLDIGVASGAIHAMAGIYFMLKGSKSDLTGFVDMGGEVSVLGIVSISIDFNLSLTYSDPKVQGRATLVVAVHVLCFSKSVPLSVERSFGKNAGDPTVANVLTAGDWQEYALAYAA